MSDYKAIQSLTENVLGQLKNETAVVTGAASGIGKETTLTLASAGCRVIACDVNEKGLEALKAEAAVHKLEIVPAKINLLSVEDITRFTEGLTAAKEKVGILINCAGLCTGTNIEKIEEKEWDLIFGVNLKGLYFLTQKMIPVLKKNGRGRIINISSLAGFVGGILASPAYSASKAGITCMTKTFAKYLAKENITVNEISPGTADTEMTREWLGLDKMKDFIEKVPLGRLVEAEDIAKAVLFLSCPLSDFVTGQVLHVNGGMYMP